MLNKLMTQPAVGLDTESDSLYSYREKVCLIQLSIPETDYLVDPLSPEIDLDPLGELFASPEIDKVFHAAEYDLMTLKRYSNFSFHNLFDTMWAARILGWKQVGLAAILKEHFGVELDKRWQRYNWGRRPLDPAALAYARLDSHFLIPLRDVMVRDLTAAGRTEEAREMFDQVANVDPVSREFAPDEFWRVKGAWDLAPRSRAVLRELYILRDQEAQQRDWPPFKIMGDKTLVALAEVKPRKVRELAGLDGMTELQIRRYGSQVVQAVERGLSAPIPQPPVNPRPDYGALARYEKLRAWRKEEALRRGVEPDVVLSNATLMAIAHRAPRTLNDLEGIEGLGPWRLKTLGQQLVEAMT